ncbi:MAG: ATP-binding cassette domain-containing protein [Alphaproteobacteria bacterium]|nr:ATP-binding cassette domain-containing protein [Alphaproteobacteria bacterium]
MAPYVRPYWGRAMIAVLITIPIGAMDAVIAWSLKPYMDVVMLEEQTTRFQTVLIPIIIVAFSLVQSLLNYGATYFNTWVGQKIAQNVKIDLYNKLMHYHAGFFDQTNSGKVLFRFNKDVDTACGGLLSNLKHFTTRFFSSVSLIGVLFYNSWQLAIVAVIVLFGALYPMTTLRRRLKSIMNKTVFSGSALITHYNEAFNGNRVVASYNLYDYQNYRFKQTMRSVFKLGMKMTQRTGIISPLMHFIVSIGVAAVIWLGSYLIVSKQITPGNFVSFITALIMLYNPIKSIGNNFASIQMSLMAMERVFGLMEEVPAIHNKKYPVKLKDVSGVIEYRDVCFEYVPGKPVLKNINLKIECGQTIAFVGNSGGGKTTLVNLLPRFYDVKSGSVRINNRDIRDYGLRSLRDKIAIVFQDNFLFSGTIRENILLGRDDVSQEQIDEAIQSACLDEFVGSLEKGLDTEIGERGVLLSGGEKQRIAIARAFIKNAPIVILDEATSALDNKSETVVQQAIDNLMKDRTVLIIAHRLSTVRHADKIIVVNYGEIVEEGTHEQLIEKEGSIYASLYKAQLQ